MTRTLICCVAVLALCIAANAATVTCSTGIVSLLPGANSATISCDGLTFSNFMLTNVSGTSSSRLDINSVSYDTTTNEVVLNENPNLGPGGHYNLWFTVSGPLDSIDLSVGGTDATVTERACANPIPMGGVDATLCTNTAQTSSVTPLANITVHSGDVGQPVVAAFGAVSSTTYIYKDIAVADNGGLSAMNESFHSAVPEPASMMLLGSALLGLALIRRRRAN